MTETPEPQEPVDKILLYRHRPGHHQEPDIDACTLAVASDRPLTLALPCLDLNQPAQIAAFIRDWLHRSTGAGG